MRLLHGLACIIILSSLSNNANNQASANIMERMVAMWNGSPSSSSLGERKDLKKMTSNWTSLQEEDLFDSTTQAIIERAGFQSETHLITTHDGYVTELINVINPLADRSQLRQPPVVFFHGALVDTASWISGSIRQHHPEIYPRSTESDGPITSSNRSLAFMLANNGYDVWLVATRGSNKQNIDHTHYRTEMLDDLLQDLAKELSEQKASRLIDTLKYMDFSQDPLVEVEYPAQIDEVLRLTGSERVSLITYSKATQIVFKILASDPVHARRIHSLVAIAPILNNVGTSNFWKFMGKFAISVPNPVGNFIFSQIVASSWTRRILATLNPHTWYRYAMSLVVGASPKYQTSAEPSIIGHFLTGQSFTESKHYCQQILVGKLQKYDHGKDINRFVYDGLEEPPQYNITKIKLKRWMMVSGDQDTLGTPDSSKQYNDLQHFKPDKWIRVPKANHIDLLFALDNDVTVNKPVLEFMEKF